MKKLIVSLILALSIPVVASAQVDLSSMSYDELVDLSKEVGRAMMQHDDFESVRVPKGLWKVGDDIPAGTWLIKSAEGKLATVVYGSELDDEKNSMNMFMNTFQDLEDDETWRVFAEEGNYFYITLNEVVFESNPGTSSLGFKKK